MRQQFYSNGKLLLTGEYVVLDGALSFAIPTKYGQSLVVTETDTTELEWKSLDDENNMWFHGVFDIETMTPKTINGQLSTKNIGVANTLSKILIEAKKLNSSFLQNSKGYEIETELTFPKDWGLGSSSTLINNIAQWAEVDAYKLLWNAFSGSGYDIACAKHNTPITYQLKDKRPVVEEVLFNPSFKDQIYFIYLNKKQNSRDGIASYKNVIADKKESIGLISNITTKVLSCDNLKTFESLLTEHETILSNLLDTTTVKNSLFPDFPGAIKSLGAWGGDFILATGNETTPAYFKNKGYATVIPYTDMVL